MNARLLTTVVLALLMTGCGGELDQARKEGAAAGREAGTRAGTSQGHADGSASGQSEGRAAAEADAKSGAFVGIYLRPGFVAIIAGITLGLFAQWLVLRQMKTGAWTSPALISVVPGLTGSFALQLWRVRTDVEVRAATRMRAVELQTSAWMHAMDALQELSLKKLRATRGIRAESYRRVVEEFEAEAERMVAEAARRAQSRRM